MITGKTDRPLGTFHPIIKSLYYPVNYGYVEGVPAGDGADQDVYYLGEEKAVSEFTGRVIAVIHRFNDVEDKWVVAKDGCEFSQEEIESAVDFQEKFFDSEVIFK
ncbi:MAG: inorganic pyrophosphatase [Ruminiclostridium sp.]|nr:inorganic pyrophosphatase [Ruminiclostridium sp.]